MPPPTPTPTPTPTPIVQDGFSMDSGPWTYQGPVQPVVDRGFVSLTAAGRGNTVGTVWPETTVTKQFTAEFRYSIGGGTGGEGSEGGAIEQIGWRLTRSGTRFIVRSIPEGHMFREIG